MKKAIKVLFYTGLKLEKYEKLKEYDIVILDDPSQEINGLIFKIQNPDIVEELKDQPEFTDNIEEMEYFENHEFETYLIEDQVIIILDKIFIVERDSYDQFLEDMLLEDCGKGYEVDSEFMAEVQANLQKCNALIAAYFYPN